MVALITCTQAILDVFLASHNGIHGPIAGDNFCQKTYISDARIDPDFVESIDSDSYIHAETESTLSNIYVPYEGYYWPQQKDASKCDIPTVPYWSRGATRIKVYNLPFSESWQQERVCAEGFDLERNQFEANGNRYFWCEPTE